MRRFLAVGLAVSAGIPATALAAGVTGTFRGRTSESKSVRVILKNGVIKSGSKIPYVMLCQHGTLSGTIEPYGRVRRHHFDVTMNGTEALGHGWRARHRSRLKITFGGRGLLGSVHEQATVLKAGGKVFEHCFATIEFGASR